MSPFLQQRSPPFALRLRKCENPPFSFVQTPSPPMTEPMNSEPLSLADENRIIAERRKKLAALRARGPAFPNDFERLNLAAKLDEAYGEAEPEKLQELKPAAVVAGRIMLKRVMGKASFITIQDLSGRIQVYVARDAVGAEVYEDFKHWDIGDIVGVEGHLFKTRTGELTIHAESIRLLTKSLRPLPDKYHGLADQELKYRQRYVDLIMSEETRRRFVARSRLIQAIRDYMLEYGFLEVETPI